MAQARGRLAGDAEGEGMRWLLALLLACLGLAAGVLPALGPGGAGTGKAPVLAPAAVRQAP